MFSFSTYLRKFILKRLDRPRSDYQQRAYNNLDKLYSVIRPGDVLLVEGRSEMSRLIRLFSSSHWSHAAMYVGDRLKDVEQPDGISYSRKFGEDVSHMLIEAFSGEGVIGAPLKKYKDYNIRICRPYGIVMEDMDKVISRVIDRIGTHYDDQNIFAIAVMALQTLWRSRSKYAYKMCLGNCNDYQVICSGMIAQAFQSVSYPVVPALLPKTEDDVFNENNPYGAGLLMRHFSQITPRDFDLSPNFLIIKYNIDGSTPFDYRSLWVKK